MSLEILKITDDLRALTIHGPWAWAIMQGYKAVENRSWPTDFRGRFAIHAGNSRKSDPVALAAFRQTGIEPPNSFTRGAIVGTVELIDILPLADYLEKYGKDSKNQVFALGPLCWVLANPVPCQPVPCPGNFQLWNVKSALKNMNSSVNNRT